jgi:hypothetical protein
MNCPAEIAEILLAILQTGLLRIRALSWSNDSRRFAVEADHLHNLPSLLNDFSLDRLRYYWDAERVLYLGRSTKEELAVFEADWKRLESFVGSERMPSSPA